MLFYQVFGAGEELHELGHSGFYVKGPTLAAGSVLNETRIVQVHASGILLLSAGELNVFSIDLPLDVLMNAHHIF